MLYDKYKYYEIKSVKKKNKNIKKNIKSVLIKPVLIKSFEMKRPFMVWIGFISICCSKVAKEGKSCPRLLVLQRVTQNAKSCSKIAVAEHNLFMPTDEATKF